MFNSSIKSVLIAGALALGTLSAASTSASAEIRGGIYIGGPGISIDIGHGWDRGRHWDRWDRPRHRTCRAGRALRKARSRGIRRARIVRAGRRGVVVKGRKWGQRVVMGFGRHRSCPVRFVRAR